MKGLGRKKSKKEDREERILLGLIDLYIRTGNAIGSSTLQENGFEDLSSATIRNYFVELEDKGYLKQAHSSAGRIPTSKAMRFYAHHFAEEEELDPQMEEMLKSLKDQKETKNPSSFLTQAGALLSQITGQAVFLSELRFEQDMLIDIKLVSIDANRLVAILISDFGEILTETLTIDHRLSLHSLKRVESYLEWKIKGQKEEEKPQLPEAELEFARSLYTEIMVRYLVRYANYTREKLFRTGFSTLLAYPEFNEPAALSSVLSLFENDDRLQKLINHAMKEGSLHFWMGADLDPYLTADSENSHHCAILTIPFYIGQHPVGIIGLMGGLRMPYRTLIPILNQFCRHLSETLTKSLYKFKLTYRPPRTHLTIEDARKKGDAISIKLLEAK